MSGHADPHEDISELLAAYADGGLSGAERARVEAHLADDAEARAEVDALRRAINATRAAQPRPAAEPAWDEMARAIRAACEAEGPTPAPRRGVLAWLRELVRPRYAGPVLVVAAAVVLFVVWSGQRGDERPSVGPAPHERVAATAPAVEPPAVDALRAEAVEDLDDAELDALLAELEPAAELDDTEFDPSETLPADGVATFDDDFFAVPDYGALLDELSEDEIDALDAFLASQTG